MRCEVCRDEVLQSGSFVSKRTFLKTTLANPPGGQPALSRDSQS